jgi:hypothetical protein
MKKIDLVQVFGTVANIGVIIGIAFLAVELRQNNELSRAEARASRVTLSQGAMVPLMQSSNVAQAVGASLGEDGDIDILVATFYYQYILVGWEYSFFEVQIGALDESALPTNGWRGLFELLPGLRAHYESRRGTLRPQFVDFMDSQILRDL